MDSSQKEELPNKDKDLLKVEAGQGDISERAQQTVDKATKTDKIHKLYP